MQRVELYHDMFEAQRDMNALISRGWRVHTCTMGCYTSGYNAKQKVLVVYEK